MILGDREFNRGVVTASHQAAADVGAEVLGAGGNAIDAAVATAIAIGVADPGNAGIGGYGGYMVISWPDGRAANVNFGLSALGEYTVEQLGRMYPPLGPGSTAVPMVIAGVSRALSEFGTMAWSEVVTPAIRLAREGVSATPSNLRGFAECRDDPFLSDAFRFENVSLPSGEESLVFRQPDLAATLTELADRGPDWFYDGPLGEKARVMFQQASSDRLAHEWSQTRHAVNVASPNLHVVDSLKIASSPIEISGAATMCAALAVARNVVRRGRLSDAAILADFAKGLANVWQYRVSAEGADALRNVPIKTWVESAISYRGIGPASQEQTSGHTTHFNTRDTNGTMVSLTMTQGTTFGARCVIPGTGVVLNNGMHNFTYLPSNLRNGFRYGVSNMAPTIATTSAGTRIALGCPGTRRIQTNIALTLARHVFDGMDIQSAIDSPRVHTEDRSRVWVEEPHSEDPILRQEMLRHFLDVATEDPAVYCGPLTAIVSDASGRVEAGLDRRREPGFLGVAGGKT